MENYFKAVCKEGGDVEIAGFPPFLAYGTAR